MIAIVIAIVTWLQGIMEEMQLTDWLYAYIANIPMELLY